MKIGVPREVTPGERRIALVPDSAKKLVADGNEVWVESAGSGPADFADADYASAGAKLAPGAAAIWSSSDLVLKVQPPTAAEIELLREGTLLVAILQPFQNADTVRRLAARRATSFSLDLLPRITRAQSMDVLSSMASIAGYKAVLVAASALPRLFPMMSTAAGTVPPARVLVLGAGVAGLQAIATARRLGAVVCGYDVRSAVKEQIESLGAKFVNITIGAGGEGQGGYARALTEEEIRSQREQMAAVLKEMDVVITTAAVPGRKAPILITREMARGMSPGSVIVDLAAERGGNCEVTVPGATIVENGVTVIGPINLPATVPNHSSQMYGRNIVTFLKNMLTKEGALNIDLADEITRDSLVVQDGQIVNARVQELLGVEVRASS
jgi:NAD(P) transhydrogenase subunit alpha